MNNTRRGLPLARARIEQIFPKLTSTQIRRITPHGRIRTAKRGEVLSEQGDSAASFFVVVSGELEILRPSGAVETLVTVHRSGQFTGEVGTYFIFKFCVSVRLYKSASSSNNLVKSGIT